MKGIMSSAGPATVLNSPVMLFFGLPPASGLLGACGWDIGDWWDKMLITFCRGSIQFFLMRG
jgi:hypothetical protein